MEDIVTSLTMKQGNNWSTGIVISTDDDKILLGLRKDTKNWATPGGKVDVGETALQGIVRETKEECNLDIAKLEEDVKFLYVIPDDYGNKIWVNFLFYIENLPLNVRETIVPQKTEFITWEWVTIEQALSMELFPPTENLLRRYESNRRFRYKEMGSVI